MVVIGCDVVGNTYCAYCHERVDYRLWFLESLKLNSRLGK